MMTCKIVGASKASILYIYIDNNNNDVLFSFLKYHTLILNIYHTNKIKREKLNQDIDINILLLTISIIDKIFFNPNFWCITSFSSIIFTDDNH